MFVRISHRSACGQTTAHAPSASSIRSGFQQLPSVKRSIRGHSLRRALRSTISGVFRKCLKPGFYNHDGCWISLLDATEGILRGVAEKAWSQYVAKEISKRKDFEDLQGIDLAVFRQAQRRLGRKTRSFLQPIRDGSFLDAKAQSKFDMAKERKCSRRGVDDTHEHRCFHCVKFASVHARHREPLIPRAHLLPSRNAEWKRPCFDLLRSDS